MGSGTLSPDLLSLHPASGQPVPVASNAASAVTIGTIIPHSPAAIG
jgi:hypothetical protein